MSPYDTVQANNLTYTVVKDVTTTYRVLVVGSVTDSHSQPLQIAFNVEPARPDIQAKVIDASFFVLGGYVESLFPDLTAGVSYTIDFKVSAQGYYAASEALTVSAPVFPMSKTIVLSRLPVRVRLEGRVFKNTGGRPPIKGARVRVGQPPPPPLLPNKELLKWPVALQTPLDRDYGHGAAVREFTPLGNPKSLTAAVGAGSDVLWLDNRTGLKKGDVLRIGPEQRAEYGVIATLPPGATDRVELQGPLQYGLADGDPVAKMRKGSGKGRLHQDADKGDAILILDPKAGDPDVLQAADTLQLRDRARGAAEYYAVGAVTDVDGFYHLNGICSVDEIFLEVRGTPTVSSKWTVDYDRPVNIVNIQIP